MGMMLENMCAVITFRLSESNKNSHIKSKYSPSDAKGISQYSTFTTQIRREINQDE